MTRVIRIMLAVLALASVLQGQERILARRLSDSVAVRRGPNRVETVLYPFAPSASLITGDELEQGSSGQSELHLSSGGYLELYGQSHVIVLRLDPEGDMLRFPLLRLASVISVDRTMICEFPGGVTCRLLGTEMEARVEPGRLRIRNRGNQPIFVSGSIAIDREASGSTTIELIQGQEALMPLVRFQPDPPGDVLEEWGQLTLRQNGGFTLLTGGDALKVSLADDPEAPRDDLLTVAGVRTKLPHGTLQVKNHRRAIPQALGVYEVLSRISGAPEIISPEAVDDLLKRFTAEELRSLGAVVTAEQEGRSTQETQADTDSKTPDANEDNASGEKDQP